MTLPEGLARRSTVDAEYLRVRASVNRVFLSIFVAVAAVAVAVLWLRHAEAVRDAERDAGNLADLLSEYLIVRLGAVDGALARVSSISRRLGGPDGNAREWAAALRTSTTGVPGVSSLIVLDEEGTIRHSTVGQIRGLSWADRRVFLALAEGVPNRLAVDLPFAMVVGDQVLVPFGRALTDPRGKFMGAIVATLVPNQMQNFLEKFDLGPLGIAWILLPTGEALFREGAGSNATAVPQTEPPEFAQEKALREGGLMAGPLYPGGPEYITAYRPSGVGDLTIAVSLARGDYVRGWRYELGGILLTVLIAGVLLFFGTRHIKGVTLEAIDAAAEAEHPREPAEPPT